MGFRDALGSRLAKQTFDCWLALRVEGKVPRKDVLCPLGLPPPTLPYLMLLEWMGEGEEFRCRLIGDEIRRWYGTNVVGRSMRDLVPREAHEQRAPLLRHCLDEGAPAWFTGPLIINGRPHRRSGRLLLPVSFRGGDTDGVLVVLFIGESTTTPTGTSIAIDVAVVCQRHELG